MKSEVRSHLCRQNIGATFTSTAAAVQVMDGWQQLPIDWSPKALVVEVRPPNALPPSTWTGSIPTGTVSFRFSGLASGGECIRDFALSAWQSVRISVRGWTSVRLTVLSSSLAPCDAIGMLTDQDWVSDPAPWLLLPVRYAVAGTYVVPPGAVETTPGQADAGFSWGADDVVGTALSIPEVLVAGTTTSTKGSRFSGTAAPLDLMWRIRA